LLQLILFSVEIFIRILPISAIALYYFFKTKLKFEKNSNFLILLLFTIISLLPYLLATKHSARYVLPLYPFMVIICSYIVYTLNNKNINTTVNWLILAIIIKYISVLFWWPNYQKYYRGDYVAIANNIINSTNKYPVYIDGDGSRILNIVYNMNIQKYPLSPAKHFDRDFLEKNGDKNYFVLSAYDAPKFGKVFKEYPVGKTDSKIYLLCNGAACFYY
ncbi:MAG: hypothetical protein ACD_82C00190G0001, partial [uncultured bacterium]